MNAKNISEILDALASRFGATGAHLWSLLVRQEYINGAEYTIVGVLLAGGALYFATVGWLKEACSDNDFDALSFRAIMVVGLCFVSMLYLFNGLDCLLNAEGQALLRIIKK